MASSARPRLSAEIPSGRSRLVKSALTVGGAIGVANALTAATQLMLAHLLLPTEYSLLVTLFVVITVVGVPLGALQATIARGVATDLAASGPAGGGLALRESWRSLVRLAAPVLGAAVVLSFPLARGLNVQHPAPMVATLLAIAASVALTVVWAGLQGTRHFAAFSFGQIGFAVCKLVAAAIAVWLGGGVAGVIGAIGVATLVTLVVAGAPLRAYLTASRGRRPARRSLVTRYSGGAAAALTIFAALTSVDVLVARVVLPPGKAGAYAAASVIARAVLLIPTAITTVLFPHVSTLADVERERRHLRAALALAAAACVVPVALLSVAGTPIIRLAFGSRYTEAAAWAAPLSIAMAFYSAGFVLLFHALSLGRWRCFVAGLPAVACQVIGYTFLHGSARDLITVQIVSAAVFAASGLVFERRPR